VLSDSDRANGFEECVVIYPNGSTDEGMVRYVKKETLDTALAKLEHGRAAWVSPAIAEQVQAYLKQKQTPQLELAFD
jgi:predicted RNA-binding protein YlxR (DUF448 family)